MTTVIFAEKGDQARHYMDAFKIKHNSKSTMAKGSTFLDENTIIVSASGHIIDLCEPEAYNAAYKDRDNLDILPLVPPQFKYTLSSTKGYLYKQITSAVKTADRVIVATDNDNEGGAIAYNVLKFSGALRSKKIQRAYPTALDNPAILRTFHKIVPIGKTWKAAEAAIARSRSDWLIGMNLSRLYTHNLKEIGIYGNFAVGRAISTTLNLICQWQKSIDDFVARPVYSLAGELDLNDQKFDLHSPIRVVGDGKNDPKNLYIKELIKHHISKKHVKGQVIVVSATKKERLAPKLFDKAGLYKEMDRVAGWSQKKTEKVMQLNYEQGYQTYPRTEVTDITRYEYRYLHDRFEKYLEAINVPSHFDRYDMTEKQLGRYLTTKDAADAHLAIIPTEKIMPTPEQEKVMIVKMKEKVKEENLALEKAGKRANKTLDYTPLTQDQRLMWEAVVRRSLALMLPPYQYVSNRLGILVNDLPFTTANTGMLSPGWKEIVMPKKSKRKKKSNKENKSTFDFTKLLHKGDWVNLVLRNDIGKTKPPRPLKPIDIFDPNGLMDQAYKYIDDPKFAKILKNAKGIGTSATKDATFESLVDKNYIRIGKKNLIQVTPNGWLINWLLSGSEVSNPLLTAEWESEYTKITTGQEYGSTLVNQTAQMISADFQRAYDNWDDKKIMTYYQKLNKKFENSVSLGNCPDCGKGKVIFDPDTKNKGKYACYICTRNDWKKGKDNPCNFRVRKKPFGRALTDKDMESMLASIKDGQEESSRSHLMHNMKGQKNKPFSGRLFLKYDSDEKGYVVRVDFSESSKSKSYYGKSSRGSKPYYKRARKFKRRY